jgi:response regulator RpfG family c-di-GMP phosphodiesterase
MSQALHPHAAAMDRSQILCVDSDAPGLALLEAVLSPRGYDVLRAENGKEALETLIRQPVDLILLGAILPGLDGFTVCLQIRSHERFRDIPIVMMSAIKSRDDLIRGIEAGADDYLFKPLDHEMMLARIKALVERKRNLDRQQRMREESILLTTLGGEVVDGLGGTVSDIDAAIDKMIRLQPRKTMDMIDKPRTVIIGLAQEGAAWIWRHYEYAFQELSRVTLDFNPIAGITLPEKGRSKMLHLSGPQLAPEAQMLIKNFHRRNISVENGLAYLHGDLCVLAVNFGREIDDDHVNFLRQTISLCRLLYLLAAQKRETVKAFDYGVYALARAAECHDDDTGSHALRVGDYCGVLAERLGLKEDFIQRISVQALLHDVGKIYTPSSILKKTEPLSPEEWVEMKKHTLWGAKIIGSHPHWHIAQSIALNHHEKWDGSGYPRALKAEAIPLEARIAALADQYDALRCARAHKPALDHQTVVKILNQGDGRTKPQHFDPLVLKAFRETAFLFEEIFERRKG